MQTQNAKKEKIETTCSCSLGSTRAVSLYRTLRGNGPSFLMELGDFALLGAKPKKIFQVEGDVTIVTDQEGHTRKLPKEDFFEAVDNYMQEHKVADDELLSFNGGLLGYVGYDIASNAHLSAYPGAFLFEPSVYCVLERSTGRIIHCNQTGLFDDAPVEPLQTDDKSANALLAGQLDGKSPVEIESFPPKDDFTSMVAKALKRIGDGEATQVVLSRQIRTKEYVNPMTLYEALRQVNPSPYMFIMEFDGKSLVGSSPELLLGVRDGQALTRPIAGTRRRGKDQGEDDFFEMEMLFDDKERQEHLLLLELSMKEFENMCSPESIKVSKYFEVERYSNVMHLVSQVEGRLMPNVTATQALKASFPAGTVTGTPKDAAMKIIDEMEFIPRGPYGGAIGYIGFNGNLEMSILIRTFMQNDGGLTIQAGAGIVAGSNPEREFMETQNKARALIQALKVAKNRRDNNA